MYRPFIPGLERPKDEDPGPVPHAFHPRHRPILCGRFVGFREQTIHLILNHYHIIIVEHIDKPLLEPHNKLLDWNGLSMVYYLARRSALHPRPPHF